MQHQFIEPVDQLFVYYRLEKSFYARKSGSFKTKEIRANDVAVIFVYKALWLFARASGNALSKAVLSLITYLMFP